MHVTMTANGRLVLPAAVRKRLGLANGGTLILEETPEGVKLSTMAQAVAQAQALYRQNVRQDFTSDDFLAERRAEADRDL